MKYLRLAKKILVGVLIVLLLSIVVSRYETDIAGLNSRIQDLQESQRQINIVIQNEKLPPLIERVIDSVVYIEGCDKYSNEWSGSGVIIAPNIILTAGHVVEDANELYVTTTDGGIYEAVDWVQDSDNDCALIFLDPRVQLKNISVPANSDLLQVGESIFTIGSPYGFFNTVTFGIISGLDVEIDFFSENGVITVDAAGNPGNSGGPVFDMQGRVIGILVGGMRGADGFTVVIPSNICKGLLNGEEENDQ